MKIVFLSNYYNHHQKSLCEALFAKEKDEFRFVSTREMGIERKNLGYGMKTCPDFVEYAYLGDEQKNICKNLIDEADVVISGSELEDFLEKRKKHGKMIFRYSERLYKKPFEFYKWPVRVVRFFNKYSAKKGQYLLCASAYTAADFAITGTFLNKAYKWGYFPEVIHYNIEELMAKKDRKKILWCGRLLDWKHPDDVIEIAKRLESEGYDFTVDFIGTGIMEEELKKQVSENGLQNKVFFKGSMSPEQVRENMENAGIYLFTSDFQEGWGAVLNESMNSGCAVVASHAIGSVPYLLKNGKNGFIYRFGDRDTLYKKVKFLLDNPSEQERTGKAANESIEKLWNAEIAAERFEHLVKEIKDHGYCDIYEDGPCSKADILKNDWFRE